MADPQTRIDGNDPSFTAGDVKHAAGLSYRQLNDWDAKGALPNCRKQEAGWRKFRVRELFVLMVCSEVRKRFCVPLERLAWLKSFMLQQRADHFQAALRMMQHGLAVFIFTDLEQSFDMEADFAVADMLELGETLQTDSALKRWRVAVSQIFNLRPLDSFLVDKWEVLTWVRDPDFNKVSQRGNEL